MHCLCLCWAAWHLGPCSSPLFSGAFCLLQGFLPESVDQFATDYIYKSFSPTVGVFVLCSTVYGVWKVCSLAFTDVPSVVL